MLRLPVHLMVWKNCYRRDNFNILQWLKLSLSRFSFIGVKSVTRIRHNLQIFFMKKHHLFFYPLLSDEIWFKFSFLMHHSKFHIMPPQRLDTCMPKIFLLVPDYEVNNIEFHNVIQIFPYTISHQANYMAHSLKIPLVD